MFLVSRPSPREVDRFLAASAALPLSYEPVGIAARGAPGFCLDRHEQLLGHGAEAFARARSALTAWKHFDLGWVEIFPPAASIEPGTIVAVLVAHLGFWSLNGCRVLYPVVSADGGEFGFAYGTLTNHAEMGEEIFKVVFKPESGAVSYSISAASRPRAWLARCGYPVTRSLQARFRHDSARALARAVT